ncbi:hypothetical protein HPB48_006402 [Haemaphysalis longicornis]|uniref:Nucleolar protein 4 n=1 Tax=Haemaphysalis longicornis TaxID=44386 RepID=A0A9J6FLL1_HAELO|nr:hypothetical protein HPB48_006402 [Haemaphysalis longicornis]
MVRLFALADMSTAIFSAVLMDVVVAVIAVSCWHVPFTKLAAWAGCHRGATQRWKARAYRTGLLTKRAVLLLYGECIKSRGRNKRALRRWLSRWDGSQGCASIRGIGRNIAANDDPRALKDAFRRVPFGAYAPDQQSRSPADLSPADVVTGLCSCTEPSEETNVKSLSTQFLSSEPLQQSTRRQQCVAVISKNKQDGNRSCINSLIYANILRHRLKARKTVKTGAFSPKHCHRKASLCRRRGERTRCTARAPDAAKRRPVWETRMRHITFPSLVYSAVWITDNRVAGFNLGSLALKRMGEGRIRDAEVFSAERGENGEPGGEKGGEGETTVYKRVAVVENFFEIIYGVHVEMDGRGGKHAGQKRTYKAIAELYAFLPREAVTHFLMSCSDCQKRMHLTNGALSTATVLNADSPALNSSGVAPAAVPGTPAGSPGYQSNSNNSSSNNNKGGSHGAGGNAGASCQSESGAARDVKLAGGATAESSPASSPGGAASEASSSASTARAAGARIPRVSAAQLDFSVPITTAYLKHMRSLGLSDEDAFNPRELQARWGKGASDGKKRERADISRRSKEMQREHRNSVGGEEQQGKKFLSENEDQGNGFGKGGSARVEGTAEREKSLQDIKGRGLFGRPARAVFCSQFVPYCFGHPRAVLALPLSRSPLPSRVTCGSSLQEEQQQVRYCFPFASHSRSLFPESARSLGRPARAEQGLGIRRETKFPMAATLALGRTRG